MKSHEAYQNGNKLVMQNRMPEAIAAFSQAVEQEPESLEFRLARGRTYISAGQYELALGDYTAAAKCDPNSALAHLGIARAHHCLRNVLAAMTSYSMSCVLNPNLKESIAWRQRLIDELMQRPRNNNYSKEDIAGFDAYPGIEPIFNIWSNLYNRSGFQRYKDKKNLAEWKTLGGIYQIDIFPRDEPYPHYHYFSYGLSRLDRNPDGKQCRSGLGIELSMRVKKEDNDQGRPPDWPTKVMLHQAKYLCESGNRFEHGHTFEIPGKGTIGALLYLADPLVSPPIDTENGELRFLSMYGLTRDELDMAREWSTFKLASFLREENDLFIIDPSRPSLFSNPQIAKRIKEAMDSDHSDSGAIMNSSVSWLTGLANAQRTVEIKVPFRELKFLHSAIKGRIEWGKTFLLQGARGTVIFNSGAPSKWKFEEQKLTVTIDEQLASDMFDSLQEEKPKYSWSSLPGLTISTII